MIGAALALGAVTSLHCSVMCGPLAVAAGRPARYLGGRLLSYSLIGAVLGAAGQHALCWLPVATVQLVAVGLVVVVALAQALRRVRPPRPVQLGRKRFVLSRLWRMIPRNAFALGLATGLLPCGMLVPAWALAVSSGDAAAGALTMAAFAVASTPGLVVPLLGRRLVPHVDPRLQAAAWCAVAVWLAVRPLLVATGCH